MSSLKTRVIITAFCFALLSSICGCGKNGSNNVKSEPKKDEILAQVGDRIITSDEYKEELEMLPSNYRNIAQLYKDKFLESLINKHLLLHEAKRKNLQNSEMVKKLTEKAREEIMIQELINKEVTERADVTNGEIKDYYDENQAKYVEVPKVRASHILVDSEVTTKKILEDLEQGVDFSELAKEYSLDIPSKDKGGDVGYFAKGQLLPEFEEACRNLEAGEVSRAIKTGLGYHIIKVTDKLEARTKTLEDVKDEIKSELLMDKQLQSYEKLLQDLKESENVIINEELLQSLDLGQQAD